MQQWRGCIATEEEIQTNELAETVQEVWNNVPGDTIQWVFSRIPIVRQWIVESGGDNVTVEERRGQ
jgi:hypothetical protein